MTTTVSADGFFTGLMAGLATRGCRSVSITAGKFDQAVENIVAKLIANSEANDLRVSFRIRRHPIHGTSSTLRECLSAAVQDDIISLDNPEYQDLRIKLSDFEAEELLNWLPGSRDLYLQLADQFIDAYAPAGPSSLV